MLSRVARAPPHWALGGRLSRLPSPRFQPAFASLPWPRAYTDGPGKPEKPGKPGKSGKIYQFPKEAPQATSRPSNQERISPQNPASPNQTLGPTPGTSPEAAQQTQKNDAEVPDEAGQTPLHQLPDLTRGIPSTLEQEMQEQAGRSPSALQTVDLEGRGRRERRDSYIPSSERNRRWWIRFMLVGTAVGSSLGVAYMGRNWRDSIEADRHPEAPSGWSPRLWWQRVRVRMGESVSFYQDPTFDKLLPDPDPSFERPYTLCLSLDDLLVHSEWSREHGWRIAKRPGMDYFVRYLSQYYELVLFTTAPFMYAEPLVRKLDPFRFIMWPLFREATKFEDGEVVKDLSFLNRDLSKVIILDTNPSHVRKQPENAIILKPWKGDAKDNELVGLIPFLEYIHTIQHPDVRKVVKSFEGKHIPTEFARREAIARREFNKQLEAQKSKRSKTSGMGALGSLLGLKPSSMSMTMTSEGEENPMEAFAQGKMLQDLARERGQRNYELVEKEIRENGEKWLKEEQVAMEKATKEAMNNYLGSVSSFLPSKSKPEPGSGT